MSELKDRVSSSKTVAKIDLKNLAIISFVARKVTNRQVPPTTAMDCKKLGNVLWANKSTSDRPGYVKSYSEIHIR
jgi:hypothetical protein